MTAGSRVRAVGLVLHPSKPVDHSIAVLLAAPREEVRVLAREADRDRVPAEVEVLSDADFLAEVDGLLALGGDGTMLGATRRNAAQVVRLSAAEHASRSRVKLSLLDLPLRPDQLLELIPPDLRRRAEDARRAGTGERSDTL